MIGHYLSSNNKLCYSSFSSQNRELNRAKSFKSYVSGNICSTGFIEHPAEVKTEMQIVKIHAT